MEAEFLQVGEDDEECLPSVPDVCLDLANMFGVVQELGGPFGLDEGFLLPIEAEVVVGTALDLTPLHNYFALVVSGAGSVSNIPAQSLEERRDEADLGLGF